MPFDPYLADKVAPLWDITPEDSEDPDFWDRVTTIFGDTRPYDPPNVDVRDVHLAHEHPLRVRVYTPKTAGRADRRAFVWAHGGGFVAGTLDDHEADTVSRELCAAADVVVVSVDYPLANGSTVRYPILHRALAEGFSWTRRQAVELGIDADLVMLGGASAGGNLTLAATMELRDTGQVLPARLVLVYPALSSTHLTNESHEQLMVDVPPMLRFEDSTIGDIFSTYTAAALDITYVSFEALPTLGELPPMLVVLNEYDDLRVSAEAILDRPEQADLDVERYLAQGVPHGHLSMLPLVPETRATLDRIAAYLRQ